MGKKIGLDLDLMVRLNGGLAFKFCSNQNFFRIFQIYETKCNKTNSKINTSPKN
jgi:hypothetical protein